jgi:hypothetical protein
MSAIKLMEPGDPGDKKPQYPGLSPTGRADLERFRAMSDPDLDATGAELLGLTGANMVRFAAWWAAKNERGHDLWALRKGITAYLPGIAAGTVTPEAVVAFAGQPLLLSKVATLTPDEQRHYANGGTVLVVVREGDRLTNTKYPLAVLTTEQVRLVFGDRSIRGEVEQKAVLNSPPPKVKVGRPVKRGKVTADPLRAIVRIGPSEAPARDVIGALKSAGMV